MIAFLDKHPTILAILVCVVLLGLLGYHLYFEKYHPNNAADFSKDWQDQEWFDEYFNFICRKNEKTYSYFAKKGMHDGQNSDEV